MNDGPDRQAERLPWEESAERLLESVPGVVSAAIEGTQYSVSEVRVWYEPTWPLGQIIEAVRECLTRDAKARLAAARFHAVVAQPDRRLERRPRPHGASASSARWDGSQSAPLRLVGHEVEEVGEGMVGAQVWIEWEGRTFSGAAVGPSVPPGSLRTPALATLRALRSCLQVLYDGPLLPGLALDSAVHVTVGDSPIAVVALTASENARARFLTAAWPDEGMPSLAVILATLHATSRTVTRWLAEGQPMASTAQRFTLVDFKVDRGPSGGLDVGVRLAGNGAAVDRRRNGSDSETSHLSLGAVATLDAVRELLRLGGWRERHEGDLRHAGTCRLKTGEHDLVVVLAEALTKDHRIPLAGATPADGGLERAAITATLQATNPFVADRSGAIPSYARVHGSAGAEPTIT
jgi:hypothetical protein